VPLPPSSITWNQLRGWCPAAGKVTAGLTECDDSLPPVGWLIVTCGLTACTPRSAPGPTLGNEYGKPLNFLVKCLILFFCYQILFARIVLWIKDLQLYKTVSADFHTKRVTWVHGRNSISVYRLARVDVKRRLPVERGRCNCCASSLRVGAVAMSRFGACDPVANDGDTDLPAASVVVQSGPPTTRTTRPRGQELRRRHRPSTARRPLGLVEGL